MSAHSIRRITFLKKLIQGTRYLEIGVNKGGTFHHLEFEEKVAVDPKFQFKKESYACPGVQFCETRSDDFFLNTSTAMRFDIIFLDGLHTYEQTFTDFLHAVQLSHERTFILIDDTYPSDTYSSMRSDEFCIQSRKKAFPHAEEVSLSWHGDTYKAIFLLKLFASKFDYATIIDRGNPQTLVWSKALTARNSHNQPYKTYADQRLLRNVLENFSSVDYEWTMNNLSDIFQVAQENALFDYLSACIVAEQSHKANSNAII